MSKPYDLTKRVADFSIAGIVLILTIPIQIIIAVLVALKLGRPVLFRQDRPGKNGKIFNLVKFRSMKPVDISKGLISDADRITPFGKILRSTSLDELPTLWNVVRGDMSLVGPRPLLVEYLPLYSPEQSRRHEVRPGVTGLAQANGRNSISWDQKFELDVEYVDSYSFALDVKIVLHTFSAVFARAGIAHEGQVTMHQFGGNNDR